MSNIITLIKDILAPKRCYGCKNQGYFLCQKCLNTIQLHKAICYVCKQSSDNFTTHLQCKKQLSLDQVLLYVHYQNPHISRLIKNGKFYYKKDIWQEISQYYAQILKKYLGENLDNYVLVSVPMYFWKKSMRGYNQSELLVKHIARQTGIHAEYNLIKKIHKTKQQSHLSLEERKNNLGGSFHLKIEALMKHKGKTIVIIDDVISTGTTLNTLSLLLKEQGIKQVVGCAFASD